MKKRVIIIASILLLLTAAAVILSGELTVAGGVRSVRADLYINGQKAERPAMIYWWYGSGARVDFPFYETLEGLGCQIERDRSQEKSDAEIWIGNKVYFFRSDDNSLYSNGETILSDIGLRQYAGGNLGDKLLRFLVIRRADPPYMDIDDYRAVLEALGFSQIELEIDEEARVVKLSAHSNN